MSFTTGALLDGRHRLGPLLGAGGMSEVYRAHDEVLGRDVAVKIMRLDPQDPVARRRCAEEGRLLAGLAHPHLVRLYDAVVPPAGAPGAAYLVMELVDGGTLALSLAAGPLSPARTRAVGAQVASALAVMHGRGVVHRDLKPANILLDRHGDTKLTDFGIARMTDAAGFTETGRVLGTAPYLSPEQVRGARATSASDIYSLGLVLLECVTGRKEYTGTPAEAALARLVRPPEVPADLDLELAGLLRQMTCDEPGDRPAAAEVERRLRGGRGPAPMLSPAPAALAAAGLPGPLPPRPQHRPAQVLAGATGALATGALATGALPTGALPTGELATTALSTAALPTAPLPPADADVAAADSPGLTPPAGPAGLVSAGRRSGPRRHRVLLGAAAALAVTTAVAVGVASAGQHTPGRRTGPAVAPASGLVATGTTVGTSPALSARPVADSTSARALSAVHTTSVSRAPAAAAATRHATTVHAAAHPAGPAAPGPAAKVPAAQPVKTKTPKAKPPAPGGGKGPAAG